MIKLLLLLGSLPGGTFGLLASCLLSGKTNFDFLNTLQVLLLSPTRRFNLRFDLLLAVRAKLRGIRSFLTHGLVQLDQTLLFKLGVAHHFGYGLLVSFFLLTKTGFGLLDTLELFFFRLT